MPNEMTVGINEMIVGDRIVFSLSLRASVFTALGALRAADLDWITDQCRHADGCLILDASSADASVAMQKDMRAREKQGHDHFVEARAFANAILAEIRRLEAEECDGLEAARKRLAARTLAWQQAEEARIGRENAARLKAATDEAQKKRDAELAAAKAEVARAKAARDSEQGPMGSGTAAAQAEAERKAAAAHARELADAPLEMEHVEIEDAPTIDGFVAPKRWVVETYPSAQQLAETQNFQYLLVDKKAIDKIVQIRHNEHYIPGVVAKQVSGAHVR